MKKRWSVQEIVASLEEQTAYHREREAFHAGQEALHQERRREHAAELEELTRRLSEFQAASAAAVELAGRSPLRAAAKDAEPEDFGPASNPKLTRMVESVLDDLGAQEPFGPNGVLAEVTRRFGDRLRKRPGLRQISDILRRLQRLGRIHRLRGGRPYHESRYVKEAPEA
jgi:hypothetical protein